MFVKYIIAYKRAHDALLPKDGGVVFAIPQKNLLSEVGMSFNKKKSEEADKRRLNKIFQYLEEEHLFENSAKLTDFLADAGLI